jgi:hypothetical protein
MKGRKKKSEIPLAKLAEEALKVAVAEAIAEHKRNGYPIAVWRDGKVVIVPPDQIVVPEVHAKYSASRKKRK